MFESEKKGQDAAGMVGQDFDFRSQEEKDAKKRNTVTAAAGYAATSSAQESAAKAAAEYAKPLKYDRHLLETSDAIKSAKAQSFAGKTTMRDPYTGKILVKDPKTAQSRYGSKWQDHAPEGDHVVPLKRIHDDYQGDPWIKMDDLKQIANDPDNMQVVAHRINRAKGKQTYEELFTDPETQKSLKLTPEAKQAAIERGQAAQKAIDTKVRKTSIRNALQTGHEAGMASAVNAGETTATISAILNITAVIRGDKDVGEALTDTAADTAKSAVGGYLMGDGLTVLSHTLSASSSKFLQALAESNVPGQIITAVVLTGDTIARYAQGEITTSECLFELGEKGLTMATTGYAMAVGQTLIPIPVVGAAVGALVGSMLTSEYCHQLANFLQSKRLAHEERLRLIEEYRQATEYARQFQAELQTYIDNYFAEYRSCFDDALYQIRFSFENGDADGMIAGAAQITRKLGGRVTFDTVEGCRQFLLSDTIDEL